LRSRLLYEDVYVWQGDCEDEVSWMSKLCVSMCICMYVCKCHYCVVPLLCEDAYL